MPYSFLIVDDEQLSRSYLSNMLRRYDAGMVIFEAASAKEAAQVFKNEQVDILFLDIKMPGTDGFGLLELLPHRNFELVFITAYNQHAIKAIKEGAADYLLKPVKKSDFIETLQRVLEKRKNALELADNNASVKSKLKETEEELAAYINNIKEKNELIEQLNIEIEQLHERDSTSDEKVVMLDILQKNVILTEDDWTRFKEIFESVHANFFIYLKEKFTGLTQAEVRLLALTKLNMSTKEMAGMLGISPETIRQTRWRLRKKINLPDEVSLEQIVASI